MQALAAIGIAPGPFNSGGYTFGIDGYLSGGTYAVDHYKACAGFNDWPAWTEYGNNPYVPNIDYAGGPTGAPVTNAPAGFEFGCWYGGNDPFNGGVPDTHSHWLVLIKTTREQTAIDACGSNPGCYFKQNNGTCWGIVDGAYDAVSKSQQPFFDVGSGDATNLSMLLVQTSWLNPGGVDVNTFYIWRGYQIINNSTRLLKIGNQGFQIGYTASEASP